MSRKCAFFRCGRDSAETALLNVSIDSTDTVNETLSRYRRYRLVAVLSSVAALLTIAGGVLADAEETPLPLVAGLFVTSLPLFILAGFTLSKCCKQHQEIAAFNKALQWYNNQDEDCDAKAVTGELEMGAVGRQPSV